METLNSWVKEINNHIRMGVGKQLPDLSTRMAKIPDFWKTERISVSCLSYSGDSGDLLLFQGDNFSGKLNQFFQSSDYGKLTYHH